MTDDLVEATIRITWSGSMHLNVEPWGVHRYLGSDAQVEFRQAIEDSGYLEVDVDFSVPGLWIFGWGGGPAFVELPEGTLSLPAKASRGTPQKRAPGWPDGASIAPSWGLLLTGAAEDALVRGATRHQRTDHGQWIEFAAGAAHAPMLSLSPGHVTIQRS